MTTTIVNLATLAEVAADNTILARPWTMVTLAIDRTQISQPYLESRERALSWACTLAAASLLSQETFPDTDSSTFQGDGRLVSIGNGNGHG